MRCNTPSFNTSSRALELIHADEQRQSGPLLRPKAGTEQSDQHPSLPPQTEAFDSLSCVGASPFDAGATG